MEPVKRIGEIDFVKGLLVIFMVIYHSLNFHGISPNRYMQFLPPSFIMITGFILTQVFFPKYFHDNTGAKMRLAFRAMKIILIFTLLNIMGHVLWPIHGKGIVFELNNYWSNWLDIYIIGSPKKVAFDILLPISYTILTALFISNIKLIKPLFLMLLAAIIFSMCILMGYYEIDLFTINMLSAGIIGMALGFVPISLIDEFSKYRMNYSLIIFCYGIVFFSGHNYFTQISSTILALLIFYLFALKINLTSFLSNKIKLLGEYSLLGYILQIVYLKIYFSLLPTLQAGKKQIILTVLFITFLSYISVLLLNNIRLKSKCINILYKSIFA